MTFLRAILNALKRQPASKPVLPLRAVRLALRGRQTRIKVVKI